MREYNLFVIRKEYSELYRNKPKLLFNTLYDLNSMKTSFNYGISLYEQLCLPFDVEIISKYLNEKYHLNNKQNFYISNVQIEIKPSRIIIKSRYNLPNIVKVFNYYNRNIFVCDFKNNDYFWLSEFIKHKTLEYI